jgi:hypothetical protein
MKIYWSEQSFIGLGPDDRLQREKRDWEENNEIDILQVGLVKTK